MLNAKELDGKDFIKLVTGGARNLRANAKIVNDLNVFPIPDGDTGENMCMTIEGGVNAFKDPNEESIVKAAGALSNGMLMSARGNSGVILSQLFAGIAKSLEENLNPTGKNKASIKELAEAFKAGVQCGYNAVINPTEGTILTVAREATEYVNSVVTENTTLEEFAKAYLKEAKASLDRTPELLKVLKEAGVIDSGGAGLFFIAEGIFKTMNGEEIASAENHQASSSAPIGSAERQKEVDFSKFTEFDVMKYGYCTEFLLRLQTSKIDIESFKIEKLIEFLSTMGDSIVAFQNGTIVKVHVHTLKPGLVLDHCQQFGEFLTLKIENMTLEHNESTVENRFGTIAKEKSSEPKDFATITVANGDGIKQTFKDLGADYIVDGGQTKNPSTEDFINAFNAVNAKTIFVLPNNGNILLAAQQAARLYKDSDVRVIESKSIGQGYAALTMLSYDSGNTDEIVQNFNDAMVGVETGEVTVSVRDVNLNGIDIKKDNYIGFSGKTMLAADPSRIETAKKLAEAMNAAKHEFMIVIYGNSVNQKEREEFNNELKTKYPRMEFYEIDGGQDVYDYLLILQ